MREALRHKFAQNDQMREALLKTGNVQLFEYSKKDREWGGSLPKSKNLLGIMLMEVRDRLRGKKKEEVKVEEEVVKEKTLEKSSKKTPLEEGMKVELIRKRSSKEEVKKAEGLK